MNSHHDIAAAVLTRAQTSAAQQHLIIRRVGRSDIIGVALILFAAVIELSAFGLFPDGFRFLGDAILLSCIIYLSTKGRLKPTSRLCTILTLAFGAFALLQALLTYFQWGEANLVARQARRWLLAPTYYYLVTSTLPSIISNKTGKFILLGIAAAITFAIEAVRSGVRLPGASMAIMGIGSNTVYKVFIPGTLYLFLASLILITLTFASQIRVPARIGCGVAALFLTAYTATAIPFRGWVLALILAAASAFIVFAGITSLKRTALSLILVATSVSATPLLAPNLFQQVVLYYESAFGDIATGGGTIEYRRLKDISRLEYFWDSASPLERVIGAGFVHRDSVAASLMGYSTETNDSGWVEVILTGGIAGAVLLSLIYISWGLRFLFHFRQTRKWESLASLSIWIYSGLLMYTSNTLLWDFGFVPVATCLILLQARIMGSNQRAQSLAQVLNYGGAIRIRQ